MSQINSNNNDNDDMKKAEPTAAAESKLKLNTPKRKKKDEEEEIDERIRIKKRLLDMAHEFEDDDAIDLSGEDDFERFMHKRKQYDKIRDTVFDLDYKLRTSSVIFEDSEFDEKIEDIVNTVQVPIIIYQTDLEPLNQKMTEFINNPGGFSADYLIPEFDDVRRMLKEIQEKGDCPLYERFVPKEGTEQFDDYIAKIIAYVKEKILAKRTQQFISNWEEEVRDGLKRQGKIAEKNEKYEETDKKFYELGPSTSTAFAQELINLKEEGKLGQGEEPADEEVEDIENADLQSDVSISEASQSSIATSIATNTNKLLDEVNPVGVIKDVEVIELDSDSEHEDIVKESMDAVEVEVKSMKGKSTRENESDHNPTDEHPMEMDASVDPDASIATGESALSPPISPAEPIQIDDIVGNGKPAIIPTGDDDDDDVICID